LSKKIHETYANGRFVTAESDMICQGIVIIGHSYCHDAIAVGETYFLTGEYDVYGRPYILCHKCATEEIP
jgi:hypothetical protein